ncbi:MAG: N-acetylmuramoyl-L-alanine amidase [Polyangiaceae bacterium]|nr:N-acetylmuramoyl-L-alanine amidase [Polyangiaceae bacterium]
MIRRMRSTRLGLAGVAGLLGLGCAPAEPEPGGGDTGGWVARAGHHGSALAVLDGASAIAAVLELGPLTVEPPDASAVHRVGLRYDATAGDPELEISLEQSGTWSEWERATVTFHEGGSFNAHVHWPAPGERVRLRATNAGSRLSFLVVELFDAPLQTVPAAVTEPEVGSSSFALAPASLVRPRSDWGATATPDCGTPHNPAYLTIHHTVTPNNDTTPPAQRIKGIQNYHMNSNGWCDIGYHFLISQDGDRWQGWKTEERSGIHTASHNLHNVGISFLGSYHIAAPPQAQVDGAAPLVKWMSDTYSIPLNRTRVLGHGEWPDNSTSCPGSFLLSRLDEIIDKALAGDAEQHMEIGAGFVTIAGQERDFVKGSSSDVFDVLVGQIVEGEVRLRNGSGRPATDDVLVGYFVEAPYLAPVSYRIEHDLPAKDGESFVLSPADSSGKNPDKGSLPSEGVLDVGVLQPGETVRIVFSLRAEQYSFGSADHPDLRAWVKHVGGYYGEQDGWDDPVETNHAGKILQSHAQLDVFSGHEWRFDGPAGDDVEGWQIGSDLSDLAVNLVDHALAMKSSGGDPSALSPPYTHIDAGMYKEVRLRARQHGEPRAGKLYFRREGEQFAESRAAGFSTIGGGAWEELVVDLSTHAEWSGTVVGLRLDPWEGGSYDGAAAWFDVDWVRADGAVGAGGGGGWSGGGNVGTGGKASGKQGSAVDSDDSGCGCRAAPSDSTESRAGPWLALLLLAGLRRRRG